MATTTTTTDTVTLTPPQSMLVTAEPMGGDVKALLNYVKPPGDKFIPPSSSILEGHEVTIHDIRGRQNEYTFEKDGFEFLDDKFEGVTDWRDSKQVEELYFPAAMEVVKKRTGATKLWLIRHRVRYTATDNGKTAETITSPSNMVHCDVTGLAHKPHLMNSGMSEEEADRLLSFPFVVANLWRPIETIRKDPLALCEWHSVDLDKDYFWEIIHTPNGTVAAGKQTYSDKHNWLYLSGQRPDEPMLFKQWDSDPERNPRLTHTAFVDPRYENYPPRHSIEVKYYCFYENGRD